MDKKTIAIIIPSYNEFRNLEILIPTIFQVIPNANIVVVDDSVGKEKEDTKSLLREFKTNGNLMLVERKTKSGRGSAVVEGLRSALKDSSITTFVEMDADLAHDPSEIPRLLSKIFNADMVIGSRYMSGSAIVNWPMKRLIQSKIINFFLKYWLGLPITDYTNGFRAYTRRAVEYITSIHLYERGFISLSEIAYAMKKKGYKIEEVPISFTDRKFGKSNAGIGELAESLIGVIRIRMRS